MRKKRATRGKFKPDQIIAALRACGGIRLAASRMLGCSPSTISNYIEQVPEISEALEEICAERIDLAETILIKTMGYDHKPSLQLRAAKYYLGKKGTELGYSRSRATSRTPPEYDFTRLTAEERELIQTLLNKAYVGPPARP